MAKFKVGDRVRVIGAHPRTPPPSPIGQEAVVCRRPLSLKGDWVVRFVFDINPLSDSQRGELSKCEGVFFESQLEPLTPPNISEWAKEQVKRVTKPQPVTELPKVKA